MTLRIAQVVAVHADRRTFELVMCDDGQRFSEIFHAGSATETTGLWDTPAVPRPSLERDAGGMSKHGQTLLAVCGFFKGRPVILGFLPPMGSQMQFAEDNRTVWRHQSGTYATVAPDGSLEVFNPGGHGAYLRIGQGDHQDLAPLAHHGNWSLPSGAAPCTITLGMNSAAGNFKLVIAPNGDTTITTDGKVTVAAKGDIGVSTQANMSLHADGTMALSSSGAMTLSGSTIDLN